MRNNPGRRSPAGSADEGDIPAHVLGLGYAEAALAAVEAAEERAAAGAGAPPDPFADDA
jgi:hypothetical protein